MIDKILNYISKHLFHYCREHECKLEVWSDGLNKWEYGLVQYIECPECYPELFKDYINDLKRFDVEEVAKKVTVNG